MLTQEGQETAHECLLRSGLADPSEPLTLIAGSHISLDGESSSHQEFVGAASAHELMSHSADLSCQLELNNIQSKVADRVRLALCKCLRYFPYICQTLLCYKQIGLHSSLLF